MACRSRFFPGLLRVVASKLAVPPTPAGGPWSRQRRSCGSLPAIRTELGWTRRQEAVAARQPRRAKLPKGKTKKNIGDERGKEKQEGGREQTGVASVASADRPPSADTKTEERQDYGLVSGCSSERALADTGLHVRAAMVPRPYSSTRGAHAAL